MTSGGLDPSLMSPINSVDRLPLGSDRSALESKRSLASGAAAGDSVQSFGSGSVVARQQLVSVSEKVYIKSDPADAQRLPRRRRNEPAERDDSIEVSQLSGLDPASLSEKLTLVAGTERQSPLKLSPRAASHQRSPPRYNPTDSLFGGSSVSSAGAVDRAGDTSPHVSPRRHIAGAVSEKRSNSKLMFS